jgi:L,D-transpeptidase ErfK/SrfK
MGPVWPDKLKVRIVRSSWKRVAARPGLALIGAAIALVCVMVTALLAMRRPDSAPTLQVPQEIARLDIKELHKQEAVLQTRIQKLAEKNNRLFPNGPAILVDSAGNLISLLQGGKIVAQDKCSTGSGLELTDTSGNRTWTFETPRGYFRVLSKVSNPVWYRPDWAFVEEGSPIPKDRAGRAVADVLGDYAIAFGDGYFIHGTLYTRMLGSSVTHGCIRVDDDILKKLYQSAQPGTPIWIY